MNLVFFAFILLSLVAGIICYLTTNNIIFGVVIFAIYVLFYLLFCHKKIKKYNDLIRRVHSCYFFINSFIISLSVKESIAEGYESGIRIQDKKLHLYTNELNGLNDIEKVTYLKNYFNLAIYKMFLNILEVYQDQGGNILAMSDNLIRETTRVEKTLNESNQIGFKHLVEFILLWLLSFVILLFMKFGIQEFYNRMLENPIFGPLILVFFIICLASIYLFIISFTNLSIKEDKML